MIRVVGIAGGTASGKSTLAQQIRTALGSERCALLGQDHYYRDLAHLPYEERGKMNFDHPDSLETSLLVDHLRALRAGRSVDVPVYDQRQVGVNDDGSPVFERVQVGVRSEWQKHVREYVDYVQFALLNAQTGVPVIMSDGNACVLNVPGDATDWTSNYSTPFFTVRLARLDDGGLQGVLHKTDPALDLGLALPAGDAADEQPDRVDQGPRRQLDDPFGL